MAKSRRRRRRQDNSVHIATPKVRAPGPIAWLRARFFAGAVIVAPLAITFGLAWWLINLVDRTVKPLLPPQLNIENYIDLAIPGAGLLVAVLAIILIGTVATNLIGRSLLKAAEQVINSVPYVRNVYGAVKQIFETFSQTGGQNFREVVLVEYPKKDTWCVGFLASEARGEVGVTLQNATGEPYAGVFVPTTPNPTSGFLLYVRESEMIRLNMTVEDGAKVIISGGLVVPQIGKSFVQNPDGREMGDPEV